MTLIMKLEALAYVTIKVLFSTLIVLCVIIVIPGIAGGLEWNDITTAQFWIYEFQTFLLICLSGIVLYINEFIKKDFRKRNRRLKKVK